jgi:hypothetical protein
MFTFLVNANRASSKRNTISLTFLLSRTETVIKKISTLLHTVVLHGSVEVGHFFTKIMATIFQEAYFAEVLQMETLCPTETISHTH